MFRWLAQTVAVALLSIRTIPQRLGSSLVAIVGIAGVVIVFVAVLSIGEGFKAAMTVAGSPRRAPVVVRRARRRSEGEETRQQTPPLFLCVRAVVRLRPPSFPSSSI